MWKCIVLFLFVQLLRVECLFEGDQCNAEGKSGICRALGQCSALAAEIRKAGRPMPLYMQHRLRDVTCSVIGYKVVVCCTSASTDGQPEQTAYSNNMMSGAGDPASQTVVNDDNIGPKDIQNHPNLHLLPTQCGDINIPRIVGGQETGLFEMPWMAILSYHSALGPGYGCGGTLINERYVLTAAHCVKYLANSAQLDGVVLGEHDVRTDPDCDKERCAPRVRNSSIEQVIAHPGFSNRVWKDDIALIRLAQPADISLVNVKPICLPLTNELQTESLANKNATVSGWGITETGLESPVLLKVTLPIVTKENCIAMYRRSVPITNKQICAGAVMNKGACKGDSGGPIILPGTASSGAKYVQRGIVSFGPKNCGINSFPGVYTNVAYYMDWILDHMRP